MKFTTMQENLREILRERIRVHELTGRRLSQQTGFRQAHVSNFLNRKRGLSLEGMDKMLRTQKLTIFDLLDLKDINSHASATAQSQIEVVNVALVAGSEACEPRIGKQKIKEIVPFRRSFLDQLHAAMEGDRKRWERFVAIRIKNTHDKSMLPKLEPGTTVLIDRHYNSLRPYHKDQLCLYAVHCNGRCTVCYVEKNDEQILFRPLNPAYPVTFVGASSRKNKNYIIGRVCHVSNEV